MSETGGVSHEPEFGEEEDGGGAAAAAASGGGGGSRLSHQGLYGKVSC